MVRALPYMSAGIGLVSLGFMMVVVPMSVGEVPDNTTVGNAALSVSVGAILLIFPLMLQFCKRIARGVSDE